MYVYGILIIQILTNTGDTMKYLLQNLARSTHAILCDFEKEQSSGWKRDEKTALTAEMKAMGMYWSTARSFKNTEELETHLQKYYHIVKRIGNTTECISDKPQPYEYW